MHNTCLRKKGKALMEPAIPCKVSAYNGHVEETLVAIGMHTFTVQTAKGSIGYTIKKGQDHRAAMLVLIKYIQMQNDTTGLMLG